MELIWKKIDGTLSIEENGQFNQLYQEDPSFVEAYNSQLKLNNALKNTNAFKAPDDLLDNIMDSIHNSYETDTSYSSFAGFKKIALFFLALTALLVTVTLVLGNGSASSGQYAAIGDFMTRLVSGIHMPEQLMSYMPYSLAILAGLGLVWMDNFYKHVHSGLKTS